jgi:hypothetical protein
MEDLERQIPYSPGEDLKSNSRDMPPGGGGGGGGGGGMLKFQIDWYIIKSRFVWLLCCNKPLLQQPMAIFCKSYSM